MVTAGSVAQSDPLSSIWCWISKIRWIATLMVAVALHAQDTGAVEGRVISSITGVGISGATVHLNGRGEHYETVTDGAGTFQLSGIIPGEYFASAEKSSFTPAVTSFPPPRVRIGSSKEPVPLHLELLPPATLRGRVFGIDGKPVAQAKVHLGSRTMLTSSEDGSFVFENVEPGWYPLLARPPVGSADYIQDGMRMEALPTYFPSVLDSALAQQIHVRPGSDESGYDIRLQAALVYRVEGLVLGPEGKPEAKAVVDLLAKRIDGDVGAFFSTPFGPFSIAGAAPGFSYALVEPAVTNADGVFEFASLPAGDWTLRAESDALHVAGALHQVEFHGSEEVRLGRGDVHDARIQLQPVFDLSLSVEFADGAPAPENLALRVNFDSVDGVVRVLGEVREKRVENLQTGRYRISDRMMFDGPYYAARVLLGDLDVTGQAVLLSPASPSIRIVLGPAATLRGQIDNGEGAEVILWPQTTMPGDLGRSIPCGAGGVFETGGLPPGDYYVIAVERYDPHEMTSAAYLRGMVSKATSVRIEEGTTATVQLNLTR